MDRYGEIYTTYNMILARLPQWWQSAFYKPAIPNPVEYLVLDLERASPTGSLQYRRNPLPDCQGILKYEHTIPMAVPIILKIVVATIWILDYQTDLVELTNNALVFDKNIELNRWILPIQCPCQVAIARFRGWFTTHHKDLIRAVLSFGRQETFHIGDKECTSFGLRIQSVQSGYRDDQLPIH